LSAGCPVKPRNAKLDGPSPYARIDAETVSIDERSGPGVPDVPDGRLSSARLTVALFAAAGLAVRLLTIVRLPLGAHRPLPGLLLGMAEDSAIAAALLLLLRPLGVAGRRLGEGLLVGLLGLHVLWSEVISYFGHPPTRSDLFQAAQARFFVFSFDPFALVRLIALAGAVVLGLRMIHRARPRPETATGLALTAVAAFALSVGLGRLLEDDEVYRNPMVALWRLPSGDVLPAAGLPDTAPGPPRRPATEIRELLPDLAADAFPSVDFPLAHRDPTRPPSAPSAPPGLKPNIVFLVMEGVRAHEVGAFGGSVAGLTPNLDRLASSGVRVLGATSPGTNSPEGEVALWYGLLPTPGSIVIAHHPDAASSGLPEILRAAGWRSFLWIHGSDQAFYREDRFYLPRGFRMLDGRHFDPDSPRTNWGFSDKVLMTRALAALDALPEPFAAMVLTISNHHPFQVPPDAREVFSFTAAEHRGYFQAPGIAELMGRHTVPMLRTVHYTDEAVGDFFAGARGRAWFERTLFIVTSDHGIPIVPVEGIPSLHRFLLLRHGVPLIFSSSWLQGGRTLAGPASLVDVPATILGLLGIPGLRAGTGRDLFADGYAEERPVVTWNGTARTISLLGRRYDYHGSMGRGRPPGADSLENDWLVEPASDPDGTTNLAARQPGVVGRMRRIAGAYLELYPWLVRSGRSGIPPLLDEKGAASGR
jgi:hypothetical protein